MISICKAQGFASGKLVEGRHAVKSKLLSNRIKKLALMERIAPHLRSYLLQPENSWIETLAAG